VRDHHIHGGLSQRRFSKGQIQSSQNTDLGMDGWAAKLKACLQLLLATLSN